MKKLSRFFFWISIKKAEAITCFLYRFTPATCGQLEFYILFHAQWNETVEVILLQICGQLETIFGLRPRGVEIPG